MEVKLVITSFKEPKTIGRAIEAALNQTYKGNYEIIVSAPDEETLFVAKAYSKKFPSKVKVIKDPGKGKSFALNLLFSSLKSDILILTDGDVFINKKSVELIVASFKDKKAGCVTGRPVPLEDRTTMFGFWANFLFDAAHRLRSEAQSRNQFIECSGYLFAFRSKEIKNIPLDVAEDTYIPYVFAQKGYSIKYLPDAEVYVKNVDNWKDWLSQKIRTSKAHETLDRYVDTHSTKRVKSFSTEALRGISLIFTYPSNPREFFWCLKLAAARLFMWGKVFFEIKLKKKNYSDAWDRVQSTK